MTTNTEPTPSGINRLPLDCLLHIFGRIPLKSLLSLRRVSPTWNSGILYICAHKKHLKVAYSPPAPRGKSDFDLFWIDDLARYLRNRTENVHESLHFSIDQLTAQSTTGLARLFPDLTELVVHYDCGQILRPYHTKIEALVRHFSSSSPNLVALSFHLTHSVKNPYPHKKLDMLSTLCNIASSITTTRLPHLQQLDLCIDGNFGSSLSLYSRLSIEFHTKAYDRTLAQLKRFSLGYDSPRWDTQSTLAKLGPGLVSLSLSLTDRTNFEPLIRFENVKFSASLTHLRLRMLKEASNRDFFRALCDHFKALKFVQLQLVDTWHYGFPTDFDSQWIGPLSLLKQLCELRLHDFDVSLNSDNPPPLARMKTLKKLTLCKRDLVSSELFDADAFCRTLATLFPKLEDLVLVCRPFLGDLNEDTKAQQLEQQVRQNLIHFSHLLSTVFDFTAPEMN